MLSPGEQPRNPPISIRRVLIGLGLCAVLAVLLLSQARNLTSQVWPLDGVRLHGWDLGNGSAVFLNRDRPLNPFQWNGIYWRSATACRQQGCFMR